jgi:hypothetical protein
MVCVTAISCHPIVILFAITFFNSINSNKMKKINQPLILIALLCLINNISFGQNKTTKPGAVINYKTGNPANWPKEKDAVIAAPKNHKILLENDHVRVLEVTVLPGETEPVHSHRWPSVLYILSAGDFIDRDGKGTILFDTRQLTTPLTFPMTMWKEPEAPHSVENLSKTITLRLVRVEMKK